MNWNIYDMRGSRETVKTKLASEKIPQGVKDFIASQIDGLASDVTACRLDAYSQDNATKNSMTTTRNIQITLVGIKI